MAFFFSYLMLDVVFVLNLLFLFISHVVDCIHTRKGSGVPVTVTNAG